ncbi:N-glycosylase/DNA lyase [Candidatus Woesearchaeota archaeon]|jgi:N-glycosylase/DNA lyase|nr:N-glycosylase/DNA lyase [Candidatus Woesearchaeota archaeon]MBT4114717.1 N-glycosylase/DNA lyase [Candidatus Woesearchaeota archaeon]MBT4248173.1 N-glycosylase/DNA lyase [Candidatus Woesearchaeota archaeon]
MEKLLSQIEALKQSDVKEVIDKRIQEFKDQKEIFSEMCFCILTANYSASGGIRIQRDIGDGFSTLSEEELAKKLSRLGHRFPNVRANYIFGARGVDVQWALDNLQGNDLRDWLVANVKGLGYKLASHFLRNIGYDDFAIIDFHIVDILVKHDLINRPKTMTPYRYFEIENVLSKIADKSNLTLAELDLYLWYLETGKVLK